MTRKTIGTVLSLLLLFTAAACNDEPGGQATIDREAPVVTITSPETSATADYTLTGTVSDDVGVILLGYKVGENNAITTMPVGDEFSVVIEIAAGDNFVQVEAMDVVGNVGFVYTVVVGDFPGPPIVFDDEATTDEDESVNLTLEARDPNGDELTFEIVDEPEHGAVTGAPPDISYLADGDYFGSDSFTFRANDGEFDSEIGTISITVLPVNDAPVATPIGDVRTPEDTPIAITLEANDIDGDELTFVITTPPLAGSLDLSGVPDAIYVPDRNYSGEDLFAFVANDGLLDSEEVIVSIEIRGENDPPEPIVEVVETYEDNPITFRLKADDPDGDSLTFTVTSTPVHGTLDASDVPWLTYTPDAEFSGLDALDFHVTDGVLEDTATLTLQVIEGGRIYVGRDGDDSNDGRTPELPKRTIAAAIAAADDVGPDETPDQVVIAAGRYCEAGLVIDRSLMLVGERRDVVLIDGSATNSDCAGAPRDEFLEISEFCPERLDAGWPTSGVVEIVGDDATPLSVWLVNISIVNGYTDGYGGGIENYEDLTLESVRLESNCAALGGGISNQPRPGLADELDESLWGQLFVIDSTIVANGAESGGGIYNTGWMNIAASAVDENEAFVTDPEAVPLEGEYPGWGGGIFSTPFGESDTDLNVKIIASAIDENIAWEAGGAFATLGYFVSIVGSSLNRNFAGTADIPGTAGSIMAIGDEQERQSLVISDSTISWNEATSDSGAIAANGIDVDMFRSTVNDNIAPDVGAMSFHGFNWGTDDSPDLSYAAIDDCDIERNQATGVAGAILIDQYDLWIEQTFITESTAFFAGAILAESGSLTTEGVVLMENLATSAGVMFVEEGAEVELTWSLLSDNRATRIGGAIVNYGQLTLYETSLSHNHVTASPDGCDPNGLVFCDPPSTAWEQLGGGIYTEGGELTIVSSRIDNGEAADAGGGIFIENGVVTLDDSTVSANRARNRSDNNNSEENGGDGGRLPEGGGIYLVEGQLDIIDSNVSGNVAEYRGAGLYNVAGDVIVDNSAFAANLAVADLDAGLEWEIQKGGAVYTLNGLSIVDSLFFENKSSDWGAGIYAIGSSISAERTLFWWNQAAGGTMDPMTEAVGQGGAMYLDGTDVDIFNSMFTFNIADQRGPAILIESGTGTMAYSTVFNNIPGEGHGALSGGDWTVYASLLGSMEHIGVDGNNPSTGNEITCENVVFSADLTMTSDEICFAGGAGGGTNWSNAELGLDEGAREEGGAARLFIPEAESPAIDAIPIDACIDPREPTEVVEIDLRGELRPIDGDDVDGRLCDIGAVERQPDEDEEEDP